MLSNQEVAAVFRNIADMMELLGEDRFKLQAYRRAAASISDLPVSIASYGEGDSLQTIPGVGQAIAAKIGQLLATGQIDLYERLRAQVPESVLGVMHVPGIGPKTALRLYRELGIADIDALRSALAEGRISGLKGLGKKTEAAIAVGLAEQASNATLHLLGDALPIAAALREAIVAADRGAVGAWIAGDLRRAVPVVAGLVIVVAAHEPPGMLQRVIGLPQVAEVEAVDRNSASLRLHSGYACSLAVVEPDRLGAALVANTGNAAHVEALQHMAEERGLRLAPDGLWNGATLLPTRDEADLYAALGLPTIAPELREGWGEIEAAQHGRLPQLIEDRDLLADLHMHTAWSDGAGTLAERAAACLARGYRYAVITDHSAYMGMVNGLDAARLREQRVEIDAVNAQFARDGHDFRLLQGSEVDILPDGSLALPDDVLAQLDWVVASLHVSLKQPREVVTDRLLRAIRNPHVDCIGHPTGRLLLQRAGADLDLDAVLTAAAETSTVLEIDGAYQRLDLDASVVKQAVNLGIKLAIDSDAHADHELATITYGVMTARRGWVSADDVVNTGEWPVVAAARKQ